LFCRARICPSLGEVRSLNRTPASERLCNQSADASSGHTAIGVNEQDNFGRVSLQGTNPEVQSEAFPPSRGLMSLHNDRPLQTGYLCRAVRAVVRHHHDSFFCPYLSLEGRHRLPYSCFLIVRGDEDDNAGPSAYGKQPLSQRRQQGRPPLDNENGSRY
jgi:hypothetical protein